MRSVKGWLLACSLLTLSFCTAIAQTSSFSFNCTKTITLNACASPCVTIEAIIPDIHSGTTSYTLNKVSSTDCFRIPITPGGTGTSANLTIDDRYTNPINMGFPFPFYGSTYNQLVASTNGYVSFDISLANGFSHYAMLRNGNTLSATAGTGEDLPSTLYDRALIMGPYHDLNPAYTTSPGQKIQYNVVGTAPHRKWVLSFFQVPLFSCSSLTENTHQIVLYESTGIIEVILFSKDICMDWNDGRALVGIQSYDRTNGMNVPGRSASSAPWGGSIINEIYRFVPSAGGTASSLFLRAELLDPSGNIVATGTTTNLNNGTLQASFPNVCPPSGGATTYVVRSVYQKIDDPAVEIYGTDTVIVERTGSTELNATASATPSACGPGSGTITVSLPADAGNGPFLYSLDGGTPQSGNIFTGVAPGAHTVVVTDATGTCSSTIPINIGQTGVLSANVNTTPTSCAGINNGTITVTPTNGTAPFQYSLNGSAFGPNNTFTGLGAGTYNVQVMDAGGCFGIFAPVVSPGVPLTTTASKTDVLCNGGNTGTITVDPPATGTPPYEYSIDGVNYQAGNVFTGLTAGSYTIRFRDANSCSGTLSAITINQPGVLGVSATTAAASCNGVNDGQITATGSGGASPYEYSLDGVNFQSQNTFTAGAGNYTITIRDANGCTQTQDVTVAEPSVLTATTSVTNATCDGGNDGSITVTANGGNSGYEYSLDGVSFQSSNVFNLYPGTYTVTVRDNRGCTYTVPDVEVGLTSNLTLSVSADAIICEGSAVQLEATSNASQFVWTPDSALSGYNIPNPIASPDATTVYTVTATLGNCTLQEQVTVTVLPAPVPNAGPDGDICFGQSFVLQGSGGAEYTWTPDDYLSAADIANPQVTPDSTVSYRLSVVDANGCPSLFEDEVTVFVTPPIEVFTYPKDTIVHAGDQFRIRAESAANMYEWTPSFDLSNPFIDTPMLTVTVDQVYKVTASTSAGCKGEGYVTIKVYKGPDIYVPNAFTPNGDGKNDIFKPFPVGIRELKYFMVYNRWGQLIYSTKNLNEGWDGRHMGQQQPVGVYVWMAQAVTTDGTVITKRGTVTLVK